MTLQRRSLAICLALIVALVVVATAVHGVNDGSDHYGALSLNSAAREPSSAGVVWSGAETVRGPRGFNVGDEVAVNAVSCARAQSCGAVGFLSNRETTVAFVANERHNKWTRPKLSPPSEVISSSTRKNW
jgi:hypothetical protein